MGERYPSRRGPAYKIADYMRGDKSFISPIMTNSESIHQFGNNAYGKPATALNILRETIMGRDLFDFAFKTYCERWKFKHPSPADFFRSMEDASAVDLDWFWRGWFYTNDNVDISISDVKWFNLNTNNPSVEKAILKEKDLSKDQFIGDKRNRKSIPKTINELDDNIDDFYATNDFYKVDTLDKIEYKRFLNRLNNNQEKLLSNGAHFYEVTFDNIGGLVMPLIVRFTFVDGTNKVIRIPAEIWRRYEEQVSRVFVFDQEVISFRLDPFLETADTDLNNNTWPRIATPSRYQLFRQRKLRENPMQRNRRLEEINSGE